MTTPPRELAAQKDPRALSAPADGRNIDPALGTLAGEGALQRVRNPAAQPTSGTLPPARADSTGDPLSYYDTPLLKEAVWKWYVPAYFYLGGLAGVSAATAAVARLRGPPLHPLVRAARVTAFAGAVASSGLLIADLGRPSRFLYMLRVFRLTSPMSVGSWILSAFGACATLALLPGAAGDAAGAGAGVLGLPLAGYTGVLLANTAVPLWAGASRTLPVLFLASATASAGSLLEALPLGLPASRVARRVAIAGKVAELAGDLALEAEAGAVPRVVRPLREGASGALLRAAKLCTAAGLALSLWKGKPRWASIGAGALGTAGVLALRFGIVQAGKASTRDPLAATGQQRATTAEAAGR